jgi:hypothetical protein
MRQVPTGSNLKFFPLLLGRGKLARHLHHYLHLIDFSHKHYDQDLRGAINTPDWTSPELDRKLLACNAVWIMVADSAILEVLENVKARLSKLGADLTTYTFIHSSAATEVEGCSTFHPLMTFGPELYEREQYAAIPFATFQGEGNLKFPLPNSHFEIAKEKRAFYHACAVMMSNLPVLLWSKVSNEFEKQTDQNSQVFDLILKQTLINFLTLREKALTGPIARKDLTTIQKNLASIEGSPLYSIYKEFL